MTPFQELSLDKDCKISVDAKNNGTWHSAFCDATYRNFYANSITWTDFVTPQQNIGADDFELEINLYWNYDGTPTANAPVFASTAANNAFYIYAYTNGSISLYTNLIGSPHSSVSLRPIGSPLERGYHKIIAKVVGDQLIGYIDSETPKTVTAIRQAGLTFTAPVTAFNGNILSAKLTNLTSNTIVWQASDAQIKNSDAIFPSPILRNFATEPGAWYDFQRAGNTIGHDNFEFEITFKNNIAIPASPVSSLFYHNGQNGTVNIAYNYDFTVNFMYYKMWDDAGTALYAGVVSKAAIDASGVDIVSAGAVHTWKCWKIGSTMYVKINDITVSTVTQAYLETSNYKSNTYPGSVFNGNILSAKLTNLTSNTVLWSYPTYEEEKRLLTNLNVDSTVPYLSGATKSGTVSSTNAWNLKTQLNLLGKPLNSTYYCRAYLGNMDGAPAASTQRLTNSSTDNTRAWFVRYASGSYSLNFYFQARTASGFINEFISLTDSLKVRSLLDKWTDFVVVLDNGSRMMYLYADGALLASKAFAASNIGYYYIAAAYPLYIGSLATTECRQDLTKIDQFQYFDRVLTDSEIRSFTYDTEKVIDIDITTVADNEEVYLCEQTSNLTADLIVNWGDTTIERIVRTSASYPKISHIYATAGNYKITASGKISIFQASLSTMKQAWRSINKLDYTKMGLTSGYYALNAINLQQINIPITFPPYITNMERAFYQLGADLPTGSKLPSSSLVAFQLFMIARITRIRNGFTFGNIRSSGNSLAYLCFGNSQLIEVEDGVKYPASLTTGTTNQTSSNFSDCPKLEHLSVNLFDDLIIDNLVGNAYYSFVRSDVKLKNLPNNFRFSVNATDFEYFAQTCVALEWDITDKFPVFPAGSTIKFAYIFYACGKITGYADPAKLWKRTDVTWASTVSAFGGCVLLTNYDEIPASWGGLATVSISTNRTWVDVWTDKTVNITATGALTCTDNKGIINMVSGSNLTITTNTGTINYVSGSIINGVTKTESGTLTGSL